MVNSNMVINKLFMSSSRTYHTPQIRSYTLNTTHGELDNIYGLMRERGNHSLTPLTLAHNVPGMIGLHKLGMNSDIPYGWETVRLRFIMEIISDHQLGKLFTYVQGYSDYFDQSISGMIDPNIILFLNSVTEILYFVDPTTNRENFRILKSYNVFNNTYSTHDNYNHSGLKVIRPVDVISQIDMLNIEDDDGFVIDSTNDIGRVKTSKRQNNDPLRYLHKVLSSHMESSNLSNIGYSTRDVTSNAMSLAAEDTLISNPFLSLISEVTGELNPTSFPIGLLNNIDPILLTDTNRTMLLRVDDTGIQVPRDLSVLTTGDTETFLQPTMETILAQEINGSITDAMCSNFITELIVTITNDTVDLKPLAIVHSVSCFIERAYAIEIEFCNRVVSYIENVLIPKVTRNGELLLHAHLSMSFTTDSTIAISINSNQETVFRFPTFADSRYSPVITQKNNQDDIVDEFNNLIVAVETGSGRAVDNLYNFN